jgi:serine/threonine protein kinase
MLSILSKFSNKIRNFVKKGNTRQRNYDIVVEDTIITVENTIDDTPSAPPPSPMITRKLFTHDIDISVIKDDYELQDLLKMMDIHQIDISGVRLENRFETELCNHSALNNEMTKIKMKLLYIIIANNMYRSMFEELKQYHSKRTNHYIGVFRYNDYIIRIDDCPYSFINETTVIQALAADATATTPGRASHSDAIILPFLLYLNTRRNKEGNDICECRTSSCNCDYTDNAEIEFVGEEGSNSLSKRCFNKLRTNTISFSIQYYVKDTVSLYTWVKENLSNDVYHRFSSIQKTFFVHLFYQCARLLSVIHRAGIVHGDIKPDNILIKEEANFNINHPERCKNFKVYLIDFGLSGKHKIGVGTGGTVPYCHPEYKNIKDTTNTSKYNWKILDVKHDVWSLGLCFLTLYIYHNFYSYYYRYPTYFFLNDGYIASLIIDVITEPKIHDLFTKMMTAECIPSKEVCELLEELV